MMFYCRMKFTKGIGTLISCWQSSGTFFYVHIFNVNVSIRVAGSERCLTAHLLALLHRILDSVLFVTITNSYVLYKCKKYFNSFFNCFQFQDFHAEFCHP